MDALVAVVVKERFSGVGQSPDAGLAGESRSATMARRGGNQQFEMVGKQRGDVAPDGSRHRHTV